MRMKAICPKNPDHNTFFTTAHVVQTWKVDEYGNYIQEISTDETIHKPDPDNTWNCERCGAEAEFEMANYKKE